MNKVDMMSAEELKFWIECLEQAIDACDADVIFDRANELYDNGDREHE